MKKIIILLLCFLTFSYATKTEDELKRLLAVIQGSFKDKVYTIAIQKSKEYLIKAPKDDKYIDDVVKILAYSYVKTKNKKEFLKFLDYIKTLNLKKETKIYVYSLAINFIEDIDKKAKYLLVLYKLTNNEKYLQEVANILYKNKKWEDIIALPENKKINHLKVYALYKLKEYKKLVNYTNDLERFDPKNTDFVLYYRGLAFTNLGNYKKAVLAFEKLKNKDEKIIKFIADFYVKNKKFEKAKDYLKQLLNSKDYKSYATYYLGYIYETEKNYKKAIEFYKKALSFNDKYKIASLQRILDLKAKKLVPKEKYYSIRVVLYKKQKTAENFIKKHKLQECFIYPFKHFYGVYCGLYNSKEQALKDLVKLKKELKIKDILIDKISL